MFHLAPSPPASPLAKGKRRSAPGQERVGRDSATAQFASLREASAGAPGVEVLKSLQRQADARFGRDTAPVQRKIIINGVSYGSRLELARSTDPAAFKLFQNLSDETKGEKLGSDENYTLTDGALVAAADDVETAAPELAESASEKLLREEAETRAAQEEAAVLWGARIAELKLKIEARSYRTHGRSFAHLAGPGGDGLTRFADRDAVYDYLESTVDDFECVGTQEFDGRPAGTFRSQIASEKMGDQSRRGSIILLLLHNGTVVLHHFGNI